MRLSHPPLPPLAETPGHACTRNSVSPHPLLFFAHPPHQNGAPIQKLFPGVAGGPAFVKAVSAALPMLKINPTVS
jgi:hypothetical protein